MGGWAGAFIVGGVVAIITTPLVRWLALATGFVDHPAERKSHVAPIPYLGGVAIMLGTLAALAWRGGLVASIGVVAAAATVLGITGLVDDRRTLAPGLRLGLQILAALAALMAGVQLDVTGVAAMDAVLTVVWIVGITNAINLLDNMDGLAAGVTLVTAAAVTILTALSGQQVISALAAGLAGACVGFLAHNARPAAIFMGDAGSLFLGYLLSVVVLQVDPELVPPASFAVPFLLLALPVLDTSTVTLARLRHGRRVSAGGKDHLSHRLVARGLSPGVAVLTLVSAQALLAALALAAGRRVVSLELALAAGALVLFAVAAATAPVDVYGTTATGLPRRVKGLMALLAGGLILLGAPAGLMVSKARAAMQRGASNVAHGLDLARRGDASAASSAFAAGRASFQEARRELGGPVASLGRAIPVVASNLDTARTLVRTGSEVAARGEALAAASEAHPLAVTSGTVPLGEVSRLAPQAEAAADTLERANERVSALDRPYLLPPVQDVAQRLERSLEGASREARVIADAIRYAPALLGSSGPRRYFLAVQNSSELRATGGVIENFAELVTEGGKVRLERFGRVSELNQARPDAPPLGATEDFARRYSRFDPARTWQNVNMSPDFATVAEVIAELYPQSGGRPVDGVVGVDVVGLSTLLELTGPVRVPGREEPLTAANVVDATLSEALERPDGQEGGRTVPVEAAALRVVEALISANLGDAQVLLRALSEAASGRHLLMWSSRPEEQRFLERLGASPPLSPPASDLLGVVTQNATGNRIDHYLRRQVDYQLRLVPDGDGAHVEGTLQVTMSNGAPAQGPRLPAAAPQGPRSQPGENRSFFTLYSPLGFKQPTLNGEPITLESITEMSRNAYSTFVSIPSQATAKVKLDLTGRVVLTDGDWYELELVRQPTVAPDEVRVTLELPEGWRVEESGDFRKDGDRRASAELLLDRDRRLRIRLHRT